MRKEQWKRSWLALVLALALCMAQLTGCGKNAGLSGGGDGAENSTKNHAEESSGETGISSATLFDITYLEDGVKLLKDGGGEERLLVPEEAEIPEAYKDVEVIRTPVDRVVYYASTTVSALERLGDDTLYDTIAAVTTPAEGWLNPEISGRMEKGEIHYIAVSDDGTVNVEEIAKLSPGLVILDGSESALKLAPQLSELHIPYVVEKMGNEPSDEGTMEWIKFVAALYNKDAQAGQIFQQGLDRVKELKEMVSAIPEKERPVVAYGLNYGGTVYTVTAKSRVAQNIEDAGGVYALADLEGEGSVEITMEEFFARAKDADILLYSSLIDYLPDKGALLTDASSGDPLMEEMKAYKEDAVYVFGSDYYAAAVSADEKFEDYVAMIHPELMKEYTLKHFVKLPDAAE